MTRFESLLRQAVEVEIPENLASRILLRHALRHPPRVGTRRRGFALAASILVTVLLGGAFLWFEPKSTLADDLFVHMDERFYTLTSTTILDDKTVASVFRWFGADVSPELGDVSFCQRLCIQGQTCRTRCAAGSGFAGDRNYHARRTRYPLMKQSVTPRLPATQAQ